MLRNDLRDFIKSNDNVLKTYLGKVTEMKEIGEGGNGLVYEGNLHGFEIAIKFLVSNRSKKVKRFKAEFLNISTLPANNNIVKLISYQEFEIKENKFPAIIMKKYFDSLVRPQEINKSQLEKLFNFLIKTLEFIHDNGIIHRDLKPQNILVDKNDNFILTDFGIASYDPEKFKLKAETRRGERLANFDFSAPEQTEKNVSPNKNMDIYSMAQICQWYVTGKIHRGTNRESLQKYLPNCDVIDTIIKRCLANNPNERPQTIKEIYDIREQVTHEKMKKDPWKYLDLFGKALGKSLPKRLNQLTHLNNVSIINRVLNNLSKEDFENELWYSNGRAFNPANLQNIDKGIWLLDYLEFKPDSMWIYYTLEEYCDFILIKTKSMSSFGIYEKEYDHEEAGYVDGKHYITRSEYDNGYAEVEGEIIDLSEHEVELRRRYLTEKYFFIGTRYHCIINGKNDGYVRKFIEKAKNNSITENDFKELTAKIRMNKHPYVLETL